jgi:hypothetical protein
MLHYYIIISSPKNLSWYRKIINSFIFNTLLLYPQNTMVVVASPSWCCRAFQIGWFGWDPLISLSYTREGPGQHHCWLQPYEVSNNPVQPSRQQTWTPREHKLLLLPSRSGGCVLTFRSRSSQLNTDAVLVFVKGNFGALNTFTTYQWHDSPSYSCTVETARCINKSSQIQPASQVIDRGKKATCMQPECWSNLTGATQIRWPSPSQSIHQQLGWRSRHKRESSLV